MPLLHNQLVLNCPPKRGNSSIAIGRHRYLVPLGLVILMALGIGLRRHRIPLGWPSVALNLGGLVACTFQLIFLVSPAPTLTSSSTVTTGVPPTTMPAQVEVAPVPDVYYIIVDAYGRQDTLQNLYGFDNSEFIDWLKGQGFYVADQSHSNYLHTELSLASSLNMAYLRALHSAFGFDINSIPVNGLIKHSIVRSWFTQEGYGLVAFNSGFRPTDIKNASVYVDVGSPPTTPLPFLFSPELNRFERLLLDSTPYLAWLDYQTHHGDKNAFEPTYAEHRKRVNGIFRTLGEVSQWDGHYFVFAHVISPHPPFIFGPDGESRTPPYPFTLAGATSFLKFGTRREYMTGYVDQVQYVNLRLEQILPEIIASSDPPPIIIIQGDHGPGAYFVQRNEVGTYLPERTSILNAYLVPEQMRQDLYPGITPVNTFRLLFKDVFGADIELLPDRTYFRETDKVPIGQDQLNAPAPLPAAGG